MKKKIWFYWLAVIVNDKSFSFKRSKTMEAQQLRLTNRTKEPNERKSIPNVLMNYLFGNILRFTFNCPHRFYYC